MERMTRATTGRQNDTSFFRNGVFLLDAQIVFPTRQHSHMGSGGQDGTSHGSLSRAEWTGLFLEVMRTPLWKKSEE